MATSSIGKIVYLDDDSADRIIAAQKNSKNVTIGGRVDKVKVADEADIKRIVALMNDGRA